MWDDRSYDTPINRRFPEASHIDVPEGVTDIGYLELSNYKELAKGRYMYSLDNSGKITNYPYKDMSEESLNDGEIVFSVPNTWKELNGEGIFNSYLLSKKNALCYELADKEYVGIFFFDYDTFIKFKTEIKKKDNIECAIIQNICPDEKNRIGALGMKVPQKTFKPANGFEQDSYVAVDKDNNTKVEFNFQELDTTNKGLFTIVYIYNENYSHSNDLIYLLDTVHTVKKK